jgi:hypothetical protein
LYSSALRSAGLAEIAPAKYRNASSKTFDLSNNQREDIESANFLHEFIHRNKTIGSLCLAHNGFGCNAAAARSIIQGVCSNAALQQVDLI